ncbi:MAG: FAD-dependent oxidoreductase [Thermodesulfobacteriota bacterium]
MVSAESTLDTTKKPKIAIIGGGIAGLAAAYHLQKYNLDTTLYERRSEVGGKFSTLEVEGIYINRGALMFSRKFNPCFTEIIDELGIDYYQLEMSKFILQDGDRLIPLNQWSIFKSGLFSLSDFLKWFRLKRLLSSLNFDFTRPDERLLEWHGLSLLEFCKKEMKLSDKMINYFAQPYSSFAYVDPDEISADHGLFLLGYSVTPCFSPKKGMGEVALQIKGHLSGSVKVNTRVRKVTGNEQSGFMVTLEGTGKERGQSYSEGPYDYCIFATGQKSVKVLMPEVDFEVFAPKTRGFILETVAPKYRPFELLIFPKVGNLHGVHGGELRHLPDGRSICGIFLYRSDGDLGAVFDNYKIIERLGWSPAIGVMQPGGKVVDVTTNLKNVFMAGDFFRYPCHESCIYTAKKVAGIIAKGNGK